MFERFSESLKHEAREASCMEMPLETAWIGLLVGCGRVSGNHQGRANSVSQVDGHSDMVPTCPLYRIGGISEKEQ